MHDTNPPADQNRWLERAIDHYARRCPGIVAIRRERAFVTAYFERLASEHNPDVLPILWAADEEFGPEGRPTDEDIATVRAWLATVQSFDEFGMHLEWDLPPVPDCEEAP